MKYDIILETNKCYIITYENSINNKIVTCFYTKINNKLKKQLTSFRYCRELLINDMVNEIDNIDIKKLRLLMTIWSSNKNTKKSIINKIKIGTNIANIVSKQFKMQPVTSKIIYGKILADTPIIEVTASPKWLRSPHMLSLFLMFTKYCNNNRFKNIKTYEKLCSVIDKTKYITHNLKLNSKKITFFLSNYNKLFRNLPLIKNYNLKSYTIKYKSVIQYDGITNLVIGESSHKILNKKFFNLLDKKQKEF